MENYNNHVEIPVGLGLALEQYNAMDYFLSLAPAAQQQIITQAHSVQSKDEMHAFVQSVIGNTFR
jgi:hypothetical protein